MSARGYLVLAIAVVAAAWMVRGSQRANEAARDELAAMRAELARRDDIAVAPVVPARRMIVSSPEPAAAPSAPSSASSVDAPAAADVAPPAEPDAAQAEAMSRAHERVASAIRTGRLTAADGAALRQLRDAAGSPPAFDDVRREIIVAINDGTLRPEGDPIEWMP